MFLILSEIMQGLYPLTTMTSMLQTIQLWPLIWRSKIVFWERQLVD